MAEKLAYLEAVIGADVTQFRKGMRDVRNEVGFLSETVAGFTGMGRSLTLAYTTPMLMLGGTAVQVASEFEASMRNINAIAGLTSDELDALGQRTLEFGANTRGGANAAADALYTVFSAGLTNVEDAFSAMEVATYTAEAGLADMTTTTETLIAVMLSYGDTSEEAAWRASNALTQMVAVGVGDMQSFSTALSSVIPTAVSAGQSFDELGANMAFLTQRGLSASRAGISLNAALEQMINPTQAMQSAFAELGAEGLPDLVEQFGSVNGAMNALIETSDGDLTRLFQMFNSRQARRAIGLFATDLEGWNTAIQEFADGVEGATMRAWEQQMMSFSASWDLMLSAVEAAGITIGQELMPVLQPIVDGFTNLLLKVVELSPELLTMGTAFAVVTAAIPPLMWLLGSLITPFGVLLGAVSALAVAFATDFGGIATSVASTVDSVKAELQPLIDIFGTMWDTVFPEQSTAGDPFAGLNTGGVIPDPYDVLTVTEPTSLWDIYESEGYLNYFSWNEFMSQALDGGWDGGAITSDSDITIDMSETGVTFENLPNDTDLLDDGQFFSDESTSEGDIWSRISDAISEAAPDIQTELDNLWTTFSTWLDESGAKFIDGISGWFTEGAGTNLYTAFTSLLQGDLEGAINAVIPNLGTSISNSMGSWNFSEAFPQISSSLNTLFTNVKNWVLSTGIPLVSQSSGFLAGSLGSSLFNAVQSGIDFFTSGDAGTLVTDFKEYIGTGILTPFKEGFDDAIEGTEFETFLTDLEDMFTDMGDGLSGLAETLNLDDTWDTLGDIGDALADFWDAISSADTSGMETLGKLILLLGGATFGIVMDLINTTGSAFADAIRATGDGIAYFMEATSAAAEGDFMGALQNLGMAFINLAFALIQIPAGIFDWFVNGLNDILGTDIGSVSDMLENLRQQLVGFNSDADLEINLDVPTTLNPQFEWRGQAWNDAVTAIEASNILVDDPISMSLQFANMSFDMGTGWSSDIVEGINMPDEIVWDENMPVLAADINNLRFSTNADEREVGQMMLDAILQGMSVEDAVAFNNLASMDYEIMIDGVTYTAVGDGTYTMSTDETALTTDEDITVATTGNTTLSTDGTVDVDTANATDVTPIQPVDLSTTSNAFAEEFAEGSDAQTIIDEQLVPLQTAWDAMFGAEGTMATNFATFSTDVSTGWTTITDGINGTVTALNEDFATAVTSFTTNKDTLVSDIGEVESAATTATTEVNSLVSAIESLLDIDGAVTVEVNVSGSGTNTDGSHRDGLSYVPYDGYIAELHKGERVLTKGEAKDYRKPVPTDVAMDSNRSRGGDTKNVTYNMRMNLSYDDFVREAKRRGHWGK